MGERIFWGDLSWLLGLECALAGVALLVAAFAWRPPFRSEPLRLVIRLRRAIWGGVLLALGAGLWLHEPVLVAAALVIGFEETLEAGLVVYALRRDEQTYV